MSDDQRIRVRSALWPLLVGGLLVVVLVPLVTRAFGLDRGAVPDPITYAITAIGVILVTGGVLKGLILRRAGFTAVVWIMSTVFLGLIAVVKFALGPYSIYYQNQREAFAYSNWIIPEGFTGAWPQWIANGALVFVPYVMAWALVGLFVERRRPWRRSTPSEHTRFKPGRAVVIAVAALLALALVTGGSFAVIALYVVLAFEPTGYVELLTITPYCVAIATLLGLASVAAAAAYQSAYEQAQAANNGIALASIFWVGAGALLVYHALWVVFMIVLNATWPFRLEHYGK